MRRLNVLAMVVALIAIWPAARLDAQFGNAKQIQGRPIDPAAPADTNALVWDATAKKWKPGAGGGGATIPSTNNLLQGNGSGGVIASTVTSSAASAGVATLFTFACGTTPGTPTSTFSGFYCDSSELPWWKNDAGTASQILTTSSGVQKIFSGTQALGTSAIAANSCATTINVTATGALSTDSINVNSVGSLKAVTGYSYTSTDGLKVYWDVAADVVHLDVCNGTGSSITPGAATVRVTVTR